MLGGEDSLFLVLFKLRWGTSPTLPLFIVSHTNAKYGIAMRLPLAAKGCHKDLDWMDLGAFETLWPKTHSLGFREVWGFELSNRGWSMPYLLQLSLSCQGQGGKFCAEGLRWMFSSIEQVIREAPSPTQLKQTFCGIWVIGLLQVPEYA